MFELAAGVVNVNQIATIPVGPLETNLKDATSSKSKWECVQQLLWFRLLLGDCGGLFGRLDLDWACDENARRTESAAGEKSTKADDNVLNKYRA